MVSFQTEYPNLGKFWEGPRFENVEIFYAHLEYFTDIWDILGPFGTFCFHLVHFSGFGILCQKIWQPWFRCDVPMPTSKTSNKLTMSTFLTPSDSLLQGLGAPLGFK
jgi:hypothetical protein